MTAYPPHLILHENETLRQAAITLDREQEQRTVIVVDGQGKFVGVLTNGDIYRAVFSGHSLDAPLRIICNTSPLRILESELASPDIVRQRVRSLLERKGLCLPVVNENNELIRVAEVQEFERELNAPLLVPKKTILVVGGAGYLGTVLTSQLVEAGYHVRIIDNFSHRNFSVYSLPHQGSIEIVRCDIRDIRNIVNALRDVYGVVLLAAVVGDPAGVKNPKDTVEINYLAAKMIAESAKYAQINRFVYASTCSVYGVGNEILTEEAVLNPLSHYAKTKIAAEQGILSIADSHFSPTILRLSTLYGVSPRMRFDLVVNTLAFHALTRNRITINGGKQWRPLLHVRDAAQAFISVLNADKALVANQVFNVGSEEENYQIHTLGELVCNAFPGTDMEVVPNSEDVRDYRVSFQKIRRSLIFTLKDSVRSSLAEIGEFVRSHSDDDLMSSKHVNGLLNYSTPVSFSDMEARL